MDPRGGAVLPGALVAICAEPARHVSLLPVRCSTAYGATVAHASCVIGILPGARGTWVSALWSCVRRESATGECLLTLVGHQVVITSDVFSADGTSVLTGSYDSTATIWISVTGERLLTLAGRDDIFHSAVFSADGASVLTASNN